MILWGFRSLTTLLARVGLNANSRDDACATVTASYLWTLWMISRQQSRPRCGGIRTRRPRLRKSQGSTAGYSNRSRKGESAFASSSLRRCGAAVRTRMEQSFFTRNVGYALLRVRYCLSYRDWNERTDLQDIERSGSNMTFPSAVAELQELLK